MLNREKGWCWCKVLLNIEYVVNNLFGIFVELGRLYIILNLLTTAGNKIKLYMYIDISIMFLIKAFYQYFIMFY